MSDLVIIMNNNSITLSANDVGAIAFLLNTVFDNPKLAMNLMDAWLEDRTLTIIGGDNAYSLLMSYGILKSGAKIEEVKQ